jgi:hypothetical protein
MHYDSAIWKMPKEQILALLLAERDRVNRAIEVLGGPKRRGRPPGTRNEPKHKRTLSAAGRRAIAEGQRKRWAAIKAGKALSPFAKRG